MKIEKLTKNGNIDEYTKLLQKIYPENPGNIKTKTNAYFKDFNPKNPFREYGNWQSFTLKKDYYILGHITAIIDNRLGDDVGLVGYFECIEDYKIAKTLIDKAVSWLASVGKNVICGPINFTTWQTFRFVVDDKNKPYFGEPYNVSYYNEYFKKYGFEEAQKNITTVSSVEKSTLNRYKKKWLKIKDDGFEIISIKKDNFKEEALNILKLINEIFKNTWNFIPQSKEEFFYNYDYLENGKDVYTGIIKDQKNEEVAFYFAVRDYLSMKKKRLIFKIIGVKKEYQGMGLGDALLYEIYRQGAENKYEEFIFSTMRGNNERIIEMVGKESKLFREYKTYKLNLK